MGGSPGSPFVSKNKALRSRMQARLAGRTGGVAAGPFPSGPDMWAGSMAARAQQRSDLRRGRLRPGAGPASALPAAQMNMTLDEAFGRTAKNGAGVKNVAEDFEI